MHLVEQSFEILSPPVWDPLAYLEVIGRVCYKSEDKITANSAKGFVQRIIDSGHHSVIEHVNLTVRFITNRGVTHELVRHRLASYSQESTRYVNYGNTDMAFIVPVWWNEASREAKDCFERACSDAEEEYGTLLGLGWTPQQAREVLPNALKTEIVVTANVREWRHIFTLRTSKAAHPQMRHLMKRTLVGFIEKFPVLFDDLIQ